MTEASNRDAALSFMREKWEGYNESCLFLFDRKNDNPQNHLL